MIAREVCVTVDPDEALLDKVIARRLAKCDSAEARRRAEVALRLDAIREWERTRSPLARERRLPR